MHDRRNRRWDRFIEKKARRDETKLRTRKELSFVCVLFALEIFIAEEYIRSPAEIFTAVLIIPDILY